MCIIAAIPQGKTISKDVLKRCWHNNPHGGGFMYSNGKSVLTFKEMISFKKYWNNFTNLRLQYPNSHFVCHFRISTHGKINTANCHPFLVNKKLGFCHNGVISNAPNDINFSDTVMFNKTILEKLPSDFLEDEAIKKLIKVYIGSGSKLSFLTYDNKLHFINEEAGVWDNGIWFSNRGYQSSGYYDRGGVQMNVFSDIYDTQNTRFASAAFPPKNDISKKDVTTILSDVIEYDGFGFEKRLTTDTKIKKDIIGFSNSNNADKYSIKCTYCDNNLNSYVERSNECCHKCNDRYANDWSF